LYKKPVNATVEKALWHIRGLHLHMPRVVAAPIQRSAEYLASRSPSALSILYDTDKGPKRHLYTERYRQLIGPMRMQLKSVVEIGIHKGASLRLWQRYLPNATIVGLDLAPPPGLNLPGVEMYAGDQSDTAFLATVIDRHGPFDLVIDDGSHIASHIRTSFDAFFPAVRPGGWYVIEDLETAYRGGKFEGGPPGTPGTAIDLIKSRIDRTQPGSGSYDIAELHVFDGIAFIRKAATPGTTPNMGREREPAG
jgi:demethylmacrocin O-methyltransferase